jgi:inosine/xanthosine triphosphatase
MLVAVGTQNPVKLAAARKVIRACYPNVSIVAISVGTGVAEQPKNDHETVTGAITRAINARNRASADLGIGLEGGMRETEFGVFTSEWCAVVDPNGCIWLGGGANMLLPKAVLELVDLGYELGIAVDQLVGSTNCKTKLGTIGVITNGLVTRQMCYEAIISYAFAPLITPWLYNGPICMENQLQPTQELF